jgi:N-acetylmuramoyl-L-alanine amidase
VFDESSIPARLFSRRKSRPEWIAAALAVLAAVFLAGCESTDSGAFRGRLQPTGFFDTVIIDAGHGGHDPGARAVKGSPEKYLALDTSRRIAEILRRSGLKVIETRKGDYFVTLDKRTQIANRTRNTIFVSIHYNWAKRAKASGVETFFCGPRSSRLAANIQREIRRPHGAIDRGIKFRQFYVLKNNKRPAVLVELGFLSNPAENAKVQDAAMRQRLAEAVARGILAERAGRNP